MVARHTALAKSVTGDRVRGAPMSSSDRGSGTPLAVPLRDDAARHSIGNGRPPVERQSPLEHQEGGRPTIPARGIRQKGGGRPRYRKAP